MFHDKPRQTLCRLIKIHGQSLCDDHLRCKGLLRDYCSAYKLEISVLLKALEGGFVTKLRNAAPQTPSEVLLGQLTQQLQDDHGLAREAAHWAMESWALALGVLSNAAVVPTQPTLQSSPPSASAPPMGPASPPAVTASSTGQAVPAPRLPVAWKIALGSAPLLVALIGAGVFVLYRSGHENGGRVKVEQQVGLEAERKKVATEQQTRLEVERKKVAAEYEAKLEAERKAEAERQARLEAGREAEKVVRVYFQNLNDRDCNSALSKREKMPSNLTKFCKEIKNNEWYRVNKLIFLEIDQDNANFEVDITGKNYSEPPQRWSGSIELRKSGDSWKINNMRNLQRVD